MVQVPSEDGPEDATVVTVTPDVVTTPNSANITSVNTLEGMLSNWVAKEEAASVLVSTSAVKDTTLATLTLPAEMLVISTADGSTPADVAI